MAKLDLRQLARPHRPKLPPLEDLYEDVRTTWLGRMVNEHASALVFEGLARQTRAAGLDPALARECEGFAAEERHHGVLCGAVVEAALGEAVAEEATRDDVPMHEDVAALEGLLRNVISVCCLSETAAVALIGAERLRMGPGPLRELLESIWADEVGHARFGWRLLSGLAPTLDEATRERLSSYLAIAFAHLEAHELSHLPSTYDPPAEGAALGLCSGADARVLFYQAVERVMIPGLDGLGFDATRAFRLRHRAATVPRA
jgi:hypothetical protein